MMKLSLSPYAHRVLSAMLASAMLASSVLSGASFAAASGAPPSADPASGPPAASAAASPTVVTEIEASRTADSSTYQLSNGSRRAEVYSRPVHYRDSAGGWSDVDPTLVPTGVFGQARARATGVSATFGSDDASGPPVTLSDGRRSLGMDLLGGELGAPFALGDKAIYPLAQTDTQLTYQSLGNGVKDTLVLASSQAPDTFTFFVSLKNLALYAEPGRGAFALYDTATGKPVGRIEPLTVFDSAAAAGGGVAGASTGAGASGAACAEASMTVAPAPGGAYLTYRVPRAWLDDPARVYPVLVDPAITFAGPDDTRNDTYVAKGDSAYHYADNHLDASLYASGDTRRALVNFGIGSLPKGTTVNSAVLQMYAWQNSSAGNSTTICQPAMGTWGYNATWANTFGNGSVSVGTGGGATTIAGGANHYAAWDMTGVVQKWVSGALANNGFVLYSGSEAAAAQRSFWSAEYTAYTSRQPHLIVDYTLPTLTADVIPTTAHAGDLVSLTLHATSRVVTNVQARVDGRLPSGVTTTCAQFAFTTTPPGEPWVSVAVDGGYLSYLKTPATGGAEPAIVAEWTACSTTARADGRDVTFAYRIGNGHGDVQANRLSIVDPDWQTAWQDSGRSYQVQTVASAMPSVATTATAAWFDEAAGNDDTATAGRGSIALTWEPAAAVAGYGIFLFDGNAYSQVGSTTATAWSTAGRRLYPDDSAIASLALGFSGNPFALGTLDLRDDPRALYAKTVGTSWDDMPAYALKVVPYNSAGAAAISSCPTLTVALPGRTTHRADAPRHARVDVGPLGADDASVLVDAGDVTLSAVDLTIPGLGPDVEVSRNYRSSRTSATLSSAGWRFGFERALEVAGDAATYADADGDRHVFRRVPGGWEAPHGDTDRLSSEPRDGYRLAHKDGSATLFDVSGRLTAERDSFGNTVRYEWAADGSGLVIRSPKDVPWLHERRITVTLADGKVVRATARVGGGEADRVVEYTAAAGTLTVRCLPGTDAERATEYRYGADCRIETVNVPGFAPSTYGCARWSIRYAADGAAITVANETGADTPRAPRTVSCDRLGRTATVASASGTSTLTFDPLGAITTQSAENTTAVTATTYDVDGNTVAETSPSGRLRTSVFDGRGNVVVQTDEVGAVTASQYERDRCVRQVDARGAVTSRTFDSATGVLTREEKTLNDAGEHSRVDYEYTADGSLATVRTAISATLTAQTDYAEYADCGEAQRTTRVGVETSPGTVRDLVSRQVYDGFGEALTSVDPAGITTADNTFDAAGRMTRTTDASGTTSHTRYNLLGDVVKTWRTNPETSTVAGCVEYRVNAAGDSTLDVVRASDGATVSATVHVFDAAGREMRSDNSAVAGAAVTRYDAQGNISQVWDEGADLASAAAAQRTTFDADGEEINSVAPGATSASATISYTASGQVARRTRPDGSVSRYVYDRAGALVRATVRTDVGDAHTSFSADLDGRQVDLTDAGGTSEVTRYDLDGNEIASQLASRPPSTTRVNSLGWPLESTRSDGVVTRDSYDASGRIIAETVGSLTTANTYDGCGRLLRQVKPDGSVLSRGHDCFGDVTCTTETSGSTLLRATELSYDDARRIAAEHVTTLDGQLARHRVHAYAADGRDTITESRRNGDVVLSTLVDGRGLARSQSGVIAGRAVDWAVSATDTAGRTTSLESSTLPMPVRAGWSQSGQPASAWIGSATADYTYSSTSGKKKRDAYRFALGGRAETSGFDYDVNGRLVVATMDGTTTVYAYDAASGSLVSRKVGGAAPVALSYESSGTGRLAGIGSRCFASDAMGRRVSSGPTSNPAESTYRWAGDLLTGFSAPGVSAEYAYDSSGQRIRSVITSAGVTTTTCYDYDGIRLLSLSARRSDGASWTIDYVYDDGGMLLGGVYRSAGRSTEFAAETTARGDVRELLDSSGAAFAYYSYDEYGVPAAVLSTATATGVSAQTAAEIVSRQPLRYASYAYDSESGLYYCSARYLDPVTAAFISKDPDMIDGEQSAFQYCSGDPVNNVDPTGCDVWGYGKYGDSFYRGLSTGEMQLVSYCLSRVGGPYVFGAKARPGKEWKKGPLDCSGLTAAAYRVAHRAEPKTFPTIPDGSASQHDHSRPLGFRLRQNRLKVSDLGFLHEGGNARGRVHHVGIYIGRGWVVEARGKKWGVVKTSLNAFNKRGADWHRARKR